MKIRTLTTVALLTAFAAVLPTTAVASPQQKLMAKRAAELDAYRKMAEYLMGLELTSSTKVRDFVAESDQIASQFDHFLKGARIVEVQYFDDGTCEVLAEVTVQQVVKTLKKICDEVYRGGRWRKEQFEQIEKRTRRKVIQARGAGAVRPQTVIADLANEPIVSAAANTGGRTISLPPIFRQHPASRRLMAKRAAELDAYRKLLERIKGLHITSSSRVSDFVAESDRIRSAVENQIKGVQFTNVRYQPDGVVEVQAQVSITKVITTIKQVHDDFYSGGRWRHDHFDEIKKHTERHIVSVVGVGALDTRDKDGRKTGTSTTTIETETIVIE